MSSDFTDFLLEYDLTDEQLELARRLKAQAQQKQLLNSLADHALFFGQEALARRGEKLPLGALQRRPARVPCSDVRTTPATPATGSSSSPRVTATPCESVHDSPRSLVLAWFASLDVGQRVSLLTCDDAGWVRTAIRMSRLRGRPDTPEGRFFLSWKNVAVAKSALPAAARNRGAERTASRNSGTTTTASAAAGRNVPKEPAVHYRRPYRLADGDLLSAPESCEYRAAANKLLQGLRVAFKGCCCPSLAFEWASVIPSPTFVSDASDFVALLDTISLGHFLHAAPSESVSAGIVGWPQASWLSQWGTHFPLAAFLGSKLEVLLLQGFASSDGAHASVCRPLSLPLAYVWATMSPAERERCFLRLGRSLFRRLLSESLGLGSGSVQYEKDFEIGLAALMYEKSLPSGASPDLVQFLGQSPHEFVSAVTTVPLVAAAASEEGTMKDMLLRYPELWLHQQFAEELAIACSEHSACALLDREPGVLQEAAASRNRRREKKQRQKLRRRQNTADEAAVVHLETQVIEEHEEVVEVAIDAAEQTQNTTLPTDSSAREAPECTHEGEVSIDELECNRGDMNHVNEQFCRVGEPRELGKLHGVVDGDKTSPYQQEAQSLPRAFLFQGCVDAEPSSAVRDRMMPDRFDRLVRSLDGSTSEPSSVGRATTSRSNSVCEMSMAGHMGVFPIERRWGIEMSRARRCGQAWKKRWHEDSRLEFLMRNRDRFASESDWDHMSVTSVPASLDEAALCPVGLESRFSYLFDSPSHSHVTSALASQATADDDAERLAAQWGDLEELHSLSIALESAQGEVQMWKSKVEQLEELVAQQGQQQNPQTSRQSSEGMEGLRRLTSPHSTLSTESGSPSNAQSTPPGHKHLAAALRRRCHVVAAANAPSELTWRYLVLLVLARRQLILQRDSGKVAVEVRAEQTVENQEEEEEEVEVTPQKVIAAPASPVIKMVERSYSLPGKRFRTSETLLDDLGPSEDDYPTFQTDDGIAIRKAFSSERQLSRSPEPEVPGETGADDEVLPSPAERGAVARKRALHASFTTRNKRNLCDNATQTAPAITLSKMYGGMVPRYIQRELARLRQENQILRYRVASLAMSQPLGRPKPMRHAATQTAPAITFSTARQQGGALSSIPRMQPRAHHPPLSLNPDPLIREPSWLLPEGSRGLLNESIDAFICAVQLQTQRQDAYREVVTNLCKRVITGLWPRSGIEVYGSFASGLALPSSDFDLMIYADRQDGGAADSSCQVLSPIEEDVDSLRLPLDEVSPGHPGAVPSLSSGWQQQLSCRLAQEKWVLSDSIRVTAMAAIPVLSFITAPEDAVPETSEVDESFSCPIHVVFSLEDPNHRGLWSKALIDLLLSEFPQARPVTLVLKQWLTERTYGTSYTGGLCSYGLLLLVIGFLQHFPTDSPASALVGFLSFYGRRFDPQVYGVSVARGAFLRRKSPTTWPPVRAEYIERGFCPSSGEFAALPRKLSLTGEEAHRFDPLWIEDPLNPTNNVGRNCFRIQQIQRSLAHAADALTTAEASAQLGAILRVEPTREAAESTNPAALWRESSTNSHQALHADLYQRSLIEHPPNLMMPLPKHAQILRSHLPQQWDSAVRYGTRPNIRRSY